MKTVKKILLVDDDIDLLDQNKLLLESKGYEVITAESGEDGWALFRQQLPDAVVVDLIMEQMDSGFLLCHRIKKDLHGRNIPVFMLTSAAYETGYKFSASTEEEKQWIQCDGVIHKPVVIDELIEKITNYRGD